MEIKETAHSYDKKYTCEEIENWETDEMLELIDGVLYMMSAPLRTHQKISGELSGQLWQFLKGSQCEAYSAPFAVYLSGDDTLLLPDIAVVCDKSKLTDKGCAGAPDLVIEITSPSSASLDKVRKFNKYLQAGVREYWIVEPESRIVSVHILESGKYVASAFEGGAEIGVHVLPGCRINMKDVFEE